MKIVDNSMLAYKAIEAGATAGVLAGALLIETEAKRLLGLQGPGVRSKPGEPPAVQTGHLRRVTVASEPQRNGDVISCRVGPQADYGAYLEFGTVHIAPRPFMRPALDSQADAATQMIRHGIAAALSTALPRSA